MRGITGSGKSTKAKTLAPPENIFSTDEFWIIDGKYKFNPSLLKFAHKWNRERVEAALKNNTHPVVVDNTNISLKERQPYIDLGKKYGYNVEIVLPDSPWFLESYERIVNKKFTHEDILEFFNRNTHNVPYENVKNMMLRWD